MNGNRTPPAPREYLGTAGKMMQDEAGSTDNRLSWSPGDFPETNEWEDGAEYTVTLRIRQTAPGEGQILSMTEEGGKTTKSGDIGQTVQESEGETGETQGGGGAAEYENPAIARLMQGEQE